MTTPADAIRAAIDALRHATDEEIAATAIRTAAAELFPRPHIYDRSPRADRQRLEILRFLALADELAGNTVPAESREVLADAREELQAAAIATPARLRHCPTHGQQGPEAWGCPECVRELREELAAARIAVSIIHGMLAARPFELWQDDDGDVLWWTFPIQEPPYVGSPQDSEWPGYHTHWTPLPPLPLDPNGAPLAGEVEE